MCQADKTLTMYISIRTKLFILPLIVVLGTVMMSLIFLRTLDHQEKHLNHFVNTSFNQTHELSNLFAKLSSAHSELISVASQNINGMQAMEIRGRGFKSLAEVDHVLSDLQSFQRKAGLSDSELRISATMEQKLGKYRKQMESAIESMASGRQPATALHLLEANNSYAQLSIGLNLIIQRSQSSTEETFVALMDDAKERRLVFHIAVVLTILFMITMALIFASRLSSPILKLSELTRRIQESKDYSLRSSITNHDEIGVLATGFNGMLQDIEGTHRKLEQLNRQNRLLLESASDGIFSLSGNGDIVYANPAASILLGASEDSLVGRHCGSLFATATAVADADPPDWRSTPLFQTCAHGQQQRDDSALFRRVDDGTTFPIEYTSSPLHDADGKTAGVVFLFKNIAVRKKAEKQLSYMAHHDQLTGLANRTAFHEEVEKAIIQAMRPNRGERFFGLMFIDLDHFKEINDTLGHDLGDLLLIQVSGRLQAGVRGDDIVSRLGGDEFALLLNDLAHASDAARVAEKILQAMAKPFDLKGHKVKMSPSIGISYYPTNGRHLDELLKAADMAMYQSKKSGRNNYHISPVAG
jgi:diguanylate cyclase (GGDEF)-like protein/PAS domain S-box-containing protein